MSKIKETLTTIFIVPLVGGLLLWELIKLGKETVSRK